MVPRELVLFTRALATAVSKNSQTEQRASELAKVDRFRKTGVQIHLICRLVIKVYDTLCSDDEIPPQDMIETFSQHRAEQNHKIVDFKWLPTDLF